MVIEGSVFPPMTNERILIMKRILFCISLRFIMASFFVHVTLSEPVVKFFMKFSNIEEVAWFLIVWFLIVEWLFTLVVTTDLTNLFFKNDSENNEPKYQAKRPDDVNESALVKGSLDSGISTPVDLHKLVFRKTLFNYYNTKYLGPYNYSSGEECVKDAVLDAAKGRHLKNEEINAITNEIKGYLDHSALTHSNPPLLAEWLDYTYKCLEKMERDYDFNRL